jgi:hypothetical protein
VPESLSGKTIRCTSCKTQLGVPAADAKKPFGWANGPGAAKPAAAAAPIAAAAAKPVAKAALAVDDDDEAAKTSPNKPPAKSGSMIKGAPKQRSDDDDDDDDDRQPRKKKKNSGGGNGAMIALIGGGVVCLGAIVGLSIWLLNSDDKKDNAKSGDSNNNQTPAGNPGGMMPPPGGGSMGGPPGGTSGGEGGPPGSGGGRPQFPGSGGMPPGGTYPPGGVYPPGGNMGGGIPLPPPPTGTGGGPPTGTFPPGGGSSGGPPTGTFPPGGMGGGIPLPPPPTGTGGGPPAPGGGRPPATNPGSGMGMGDPDIIGGGQPPAGGGVPQPPVGGGVPQPPVGGGIGQPPGGFPQPGGVPQPGGGRPPIGGGIGQPPGGIPGGGIGGQPGGGAQADPNPAPFGARTDGDKKAEIDRFFTGAFDGPKKEFFTFSARANAGKVSAKLNRYDVTKGFADLGSFKVPNIATRVAIDSNKGLLYAATIANPNVQALGNQQYDQGAGTGDIHIYDLNAIRDKKIAPDADLRPLVINVARTIRGMELSPDGKFLIVATTITSGKTHKSFLTKYDTETRKVVGNPTSLDAVWDMTKTSDGKNLLIIDMVERGTTASSVHFYDMENLTQIRKRNLQGIANDVGTTAAGQIAAAVGSANGVKVVLSTETGTRDLELGIGWKAAAKPGYVEYSPDGKLSSYQDIPVSRGHTRNSAGRPASTSTMCPIPTRRRA